MTNHEEPKTSMGSSTLMIFPHVVLYQKSDPNVDESGKDWDFRRFNFNMFWLLESYYSEAVGFGAGGFLCSSCWLSKRSQLAWLYPAALPGCRYPCCHLLCSSGPLGCRQKADVVRHRHRKQGASGTPARFARKRCGRRTLFALAPSRSVTAQLLEPACGQKARIRHGPAVSGGRLRSGCRWLYLRARSLCVVHLRAGRIHPGSAAAPSFRYAPVLYSML